MSDTIKVVVRVRPIFESETLWSINDDSVCLSTCKEKRFCFDRVFDQISQTSEVYEETASSLVDAVMQGFNGTIFAYGQTAAGKTYTMQGDEDSPGIIQMSVRAIFEAIENGSNREFLVRVSYMEIYQETVVDLLGDATRSLSIKENQKGVFVDQLHEEVVSGANQALEHLKRGQDIRHVGTTQMNDRSSRSHTIFRVMIESRERGADDDTVIVSHLNLVDLAGSENAKSAATSGQRLSEGCHINRSLLSLSRVIHQLSTGAKFVNYRDSHLTRILKSSLGGNAKTVMIANVNPVSIEETHSTLRFATSAKCIQNKPVVNEVVSGDTMLRRYQKEIEQLRKELQRATFGKPTGNEALQEELAAQQEKINKLTALICVSGQQRKTARLEPKRRETWCPRMFAQQPLLTKGYESAGRKRFSPDLALPSLREKPASSSSEEEHTPILRIPSVETSSEERSVFELEATDEREMAEVWNKTLQDEIAELKSSIESSLVEQSRLKQLLTESEKQMTVMAADHQQQIVELNAAKEKQASEEMAKLKDDFEENCRMSYQDNLQLKRLQDEINMKDDKISALANEHETLKAERRSFEEKSVAAVNYLTMQISQLQAELNAMHEKDAEITKLKDEMKSAEERSLAREQVLNLQISKLQAELKTANGREESEEVIRLKDELSQVRRSAYYKDLDLKRTLIKCQDEINVKDDKISAMTREHNKICAEMKSCEEKGGVELNGLKEQISKLEAYIDHIRKSNFDEDKRLRDIIETCEDEIADEKNKVADLTACHQKEIELKNKELAIERIKLFTVEEEFRKAKERAESEIRCRGDEIQDMRKRHERKEMKLKNEIRKIQNEQNDASVLEAPPKKESVPLQPASTLENYVLVTGAERIPIEFQLKMKLHQLTKDNAALREQLRHLQGSS